MLVNINDDLATRVDVASFKMRDVILLFLSILFFFFFLSLLLYLSAQSHWHLLFLLVEVPYQSKYIHKVMHILREEECHMSELIFPIKWNKLSSYLRPRPLVVLNSRQLVLGSYKHPNWDMTNSSEVDIRGKVHSIELSVFLGTVIIILESIETNSL